MALHGPDEAGQRAVPVTSGKRAGTDGGGEHTAPGGVEVNDNKLVLVANLGVVIGGAMRDVSWLRSHRAGDGNDGRRRGINPSGAGKNILLDFGDHFAGG